MLPANPCRWAWYWYIWPSSPGLGAHHQAMFLGLFLFFLCVAHVYQRHQDRLILREGLLVVFFLAGLVVLGGQQPWWLQPVLMSMSSDQVFGAAILTAFTDNAALIYLGSLVEGLSYGFKYALVAGAVTGGGLTIIANAPNPSGNSILRGHFDEESVHPLGPCRRARRHRPCHCALRRHSRVTVRHGRCRGHQ